MHLYNIEIYCICALRKIKSIIRDGRSVMSIFVASDVSRPNDTIYFLGQGWNTDSGVVVFITDGTILWRCEAVVNSKYNKLPTIIYGGFGCERIIWVDFSRVPIKLDDKTKKIVAREVRKMLKS